MADAAATIKPWQQEPNRCTEFHLPAPLQLHLQIFKADTTDMVFFKAVKLTKKSLLHLKIQDAEMEPVDSSFKNETEKNIYFFNGK